MKKLVVWLMLCFVLVFCGRCEESQAAVQVLTWNLTDTGKHLDWDGKTVFKTQFNSAVKVWNSYKKGVIRKDNITRLQDMVVSDYFEVSSTAGVTCNDGTLRFNKFVMLSLSKTQQKNVCIHELGHALGLGHNTKKDIMYPYVTNRVKLSKNDKRSYDYVYKYCY